MTARVVGAVVGATAMVIAGVLSGSWWWVIALCGAASAVGAVFDRQVVYAQVVTVLALGVGLSVEGAGWFVPLLVGATIGATELGAAVDRTTIVRPDVRSARDVVSAALLAVVVSAGVLAVGALPSTAAAGSVVVAAVAAVAATRVIAR